MTRIADQSSARPNTADESIVLPLLDSNDLPTHIQMSGMISPHLRSIVQLN